MGQAPNAHLNSIDALDVSANGIRQHVLTAGVGPLVLLLHGFPEHSYAWRHQLGALADAGFRAAAPDLRGYGGTDKTPRGYDAHTLAGDIAGLVRVLGERDAVLVGHDWGGLIAWAVATLHPQVVRRVVVLGAPHPLRLRGGMLGDPRRQLRAAASAFAFQLPRGPEGWLTRDGAAGVERLLRGWSGPAWPRSDDFADAAATYRRAMLAPSAAHCALEYYRWVVRSQVRPDGWRFARLMATPVTAPVLQLHGALDPYVLPRTASGSGRYVAGEYEWRLIDGAGHFLPEEAPDVVTGELLRWAK